jgi:hypothetical protein
MGTAHQRQVSRGEFVAQGPLVEVSFAPHPADVELRAREGATWQPIPHRMMLDTGAALAIVEDPVPKFLQLEPIRFQSIAGVTGDLDCPVYRLEINIRSSNHEDSRIRFIADIVAIPPVPEVVRPHVGLLGHDFLQLVRFEYDGPVACTD